MEGLIRIQKSIQAQIAKDYTNFKKSPKVRISRSYVRARSSSLEAEWTKFQSNYYELIAMAELTEEKEHLVKNLHDEVRENYYAYKEDLDEALEGFSVTAESSEGNFKDHKEESPKSITLPKIDIPIFSGKYVEWPTFHDLFESIIHKNTDLAGVQKLYYLKGHITGEAELLLRHVPITEANYEKSWNIIKKRYSNKRYIANNILARLFGQRNLHTEDSNGIRNLLDTTNECLNALSNLGFDISTWDVLIVYIVSQRLDTESRRQWEQKICNNLDDSPDLKELYTFLEGRFRALEFLEVKEKKSYIEQRHRSNVFSVAAVVCIYCKENHLLEQCSKFQQLDFNSRTEFIQHSRLCFNCFGGNHTVSKCRHFNSCQRCGRRHHVLLHSENPAASQGLAHTSQSQAGHGIEMSNIMTNMASSPVGAHGEVMLATALVKIETKKACIILRALLDQGSQASFITERAVQLLGLRKSATEGVVSGVGGDTQNLSVKYMVGFKLQSTIRPFSCDVQAYVLNCLSSILPANPIKIRNWPEFQTLDLADPRCDKPGKIDLLLGADLYGLILTHGLIRHPSGSLIAQNTLLGWIVSGRAPAQTLQARSILSLHIRDETVSELLRKFWELETDLPKDIISEEDKKCEDFFQSTTCRDESGRYIVRLPFVNEVPDCRAGEYRKVALKRFHFLERKLNKDPELKREYSKVLKEYLDMNHMELVRDEDPVHQRDSIYLPHHAVVRPEKITSKVRVVFDASCKGAHGKSLNDYLLVGPRLQPDLRHIILNWRTYPICFVADIVKMYRQIRISAEDANYQRILWRDNPDEEIQDYRLLRVTFGVSSAPFLAVRSLQQVAKDEGDHYPLARDRVLKEFYMDDFMSGCENEIEGEEIYNQVVDMLHKGGFELQKWRSNSARLNEEFNAGKEHKESLELKSDEVVKILGLTWNVSLDCFQYKVKLPESKGLFSKRAILSDISRLFDPMGWVAPVTVKAKIYMQKLWLTGVTWDQEVPSDLLNQWVSFRDELNALNNFMIPRWVSTGKNSKVELHGFCDASEAAYAAVVYLRVINETDAHVSLLAARTRVSPLKQVSVPRLELCGAVLLAKLLYEISNVLDIHKTQLRAWTDSTIVLAWLRGEPRRWKTFVANRVSEILKVLDNDQWSHVESEQNPADCASRGMSPKEFMQYGPWIKGPCWLRDRQFTVPDIPFVSVTLEEKIIVHTAVVQTSSELPVWTKFSSLQKLLRVITYCCRFIRRVRTKSLETSSFITVKELNESLTIAIKSCQKISFPEELHRLSLSKSVSKGSPLKSLCPFLDEQGVIRVQGRIQQSQVAYDVKHPIILPHSHHLSNLIVADAHLKTLHGGFQLMLNYIRSKFWIIRVKSLIKRHYKTCIRCLRYSQTSIQPLMGNLPEARVSANRAFLKSGVDYAGPINVRLSKGRGCKCSKGYICVFVCMSTRAIHLEAVSDMTTAGFLAAFERFVGRRGYCQEMWSDNGSNFIGASRELVKLFQDENNSMLKEVAENLASRGTDWHFIPPHAPNFGGLWEAGVKSTKWHLKRVLDGSTLTFEELATMLVKIEACLNSRPLYKVMDGEELALTPGHFLIGEPLISVPNKHLEHVKNCSLSRWQLMQKLVQQFWRRWSKEYLTTLQNRYKWSKITPEPNIGDIVLVKEDDLPPTKWLLGVITEKHPGTDKITRVVTLKCKNNFIKRAVSRLIILLNMLEET